MSATNLSTTSESNDDSRVLTLSVQSSNPWLAEIRLTIMDEVSIQQTSENTYIMRVYENGLNYPSPHSAVMDIVTDDQYYHVFAYLARNGFEPKARHNRQGHKFFRKMGLKPAYVRGKHIEPD
ncbi:hypothetical protein [Nitrosomonas sp. Nm132]|jgi:hypothetical protein|uniref:hypothetical protein n=1 Tax=Nitrosomonas sp. Nm132 TaxID=1881053 RepID=UPI00088B2EED|nr:hypothetical protein [Nitrosomonas sp. Nm132]SDH28030.1 hypothetical protein SAMN05428952_1009108 [Nitrosomonas sp. Nm132]